MKESPHLARIASLMGEPARAQVLTALMTGQALTATELAQQAGVSASTMSSHLNQLLQAKLIQLIAQGRHRYFSLNGEDVAQLLEMMMGVAYRTGTVRLQSSPKEPLLRKARICYDHLAGQMAVAAYEAMQTLKWIDIDDQTQQPRITTQGFASLTQFGLDCTSWHIAIEKPARNTTLRPVCRHCLDWGERRYHLAGQLGRNLLQRYQTLGWVRRVEGTRIMQFSPLGEAQFNAFFGLSANLD